MLPKYRLENYSLIKNYSLIDNYKDQLQKAIADIDSSEIASLAKLITNTGEKGKTIFIAGNGGSSATASHMVCDIQKTGKTGIKVICLNDNVPLLTAWSNDFGYEYIFSKTLKSMASRNDLFIIISASGSSANIVKGVKIAKELGVRNFGLLGFDGGAVKKYLDGFILIKSKHYGVVEDVHLVINHMITELLKVA